MSKQVTEVDKKHLFEELHSAIEQDKRYWIQNEAKIKAVNTAKNYDEFRETVAAAHLAPLSKKEMAKKVHSWNSVAYNKSQ